MRPSVKAAWHKFSEPLEGRVGWMYLDNAEPDGLVTIGVGNLIDPIGNALVLPFTIGEYPATRQEIIEAWRTVKSHQELKASGGGAFAYLTKLRLRESAIDRLVEQKLNEVDLQLAAMLPDWESWPADAQLALLSWAWAVGAHSPYPKMFAALRARDFETAAEECTITPEHGTIVRRNEANRMLLRNAARALRDSLWLGTLFWPADLSRRDTVPIPLPFDAQSVPPLPSTLTEAEEEDVGTTLVEIEERLQGK